MSMNSAQRLERRDKRLHETFHDVSPVWLTNNTYNGRDEIFSFNIIYQHPVHGWISQHAKYDTYNDVLYRMGELRVSDEALEEIQEQDPYLSNSGIGSVPNNPVQRY